VQNLLRADGAARIAGIVTLSGAIWFHPPTGTELGNWFSGKLQFDPQFAGLFLLPSHQLVAISEKS
jgi:hypothetical protein